MHRSNRFFPASRRDFLQLGAVAALGAPLFGLQRSSAAANRYEPEVSDDGMLTQPWFMQTFLDLREDLEETTGEGRRFAVLWEQKGCPYCREMHNVNFARPDIHEYVRDHFGILQLNLWGSREVTDFDGEVLEERKLARKWRVNFTPTMQFFPASIEGRSGQSAHDLEVARMPGYFKPFHFVSMFEFVQQEAYARDNFQRFLQVKFEALKARGIDPNVW